MEVDVKRETLMYGRAEDKEQSVSYGYISVAQSLSLSYRIRANGLLTRSPGPHTVFFFPKCKALLMRLCNDINGSIRCERRREPINAHRGAKKNPLRDNNITITKSDVSTSTCTPAAAMCARSSSDLSPLHTHSHCCCCRFTFQLGILPFVGNNTGSKSRLQAPCRLLLSLPT